MTSRMRRDALGDGLDRGVDGIDLVVAGRLAAAVVEVILQDDRFRLGVQSLPAAIAGPQLLWGGKGIQAEERFLHVARAGAIVENEAVAVGGEDEGDVQGFGIVQGLLHAVADAVVVVLGLDEPQGDVRLEVEDVVGPFGLAAGDELAADDDAALGEVDLFADLQQGIPAGPR